MTPTQLRFLKYVEQTDACWFWRGAHLPRGYGRFYLAGRVEYAHRASLRLFSERAPGAGDLVLHECDTPACVNPEHLKIGTQIDNMRDASARGRTVNKSDWVGAKNPKAKLTNEQTHDVARRATNGENTKLLAVEYGVSRTRVQQIARAKRDGGGWAVEDFGA